METVDIDFSKRYNFADYLTWLDDKRRELINGIVHLMTPAPARKHQGISWNLEQKIGEAIKQKKQCRAYHAPFDVRLPKKNEKSDTEIHTVVQPDIIVICDLGKLDKKGCLGAPDLIIEILSPATAKKDLNDKFYLYQESGVREYWIVNPNDENVNVFLLDKKGKYQLIGMYAGNMRIKVNIFDDFEIAVEDIFKE